MTFNRRFVSGIAFIILIFVTAACASTKSSTTDEEVTSVLTQEQATVIAENALQALNTGDYPGWSRDWSEAMKSAIKEADFMAFRKEFLATYGPYQSISLVELAPGKNPGFVQWRALSNFEKGKVRFIFGFKSDGDKVEGVFPEPVN